MDYIISQLVSNFDFAFMLVVNVITYIIIKIVDELNGDKVPNTWQKRVIFIISALILAVIYKYYSNVEIHIIINSCIVAPVAWSWLAKPIANKLGIDYKKYKN